MSNKNSVNSLKEEFFIGNVSPKSILIQFLVKGYSWSTTSELVRSFDNDEEKELLSHDEMKHILKWVVNSNKVALYDEYEQFYSLHKDMNYEDIVDVVYYIFENQAPSLKSMGYSGKNNLVNVKRWCW